MPKILRAYGPNGNQDMVEWNWCGAGEPVGMHGFVCSSACSCGCGRSFTGIDSAKACTRASVEEVPEAELRDMQARLRATTLKGWNNDAGLARRAVRMFNQLSADLEQFAVGDVLTGGKGGRSINLRKA